jgi:hypothetical protein
MYTTRCIHNAEFDALIPLDGVIYRISYQNVNLPLSYRIGIGSPALFEYAPEIGFDQIIIIFFIINLFIIIISKHVYQRLMPIISNLGFLRQNIRCWSMYKTGIRSQCGTYMMFERTLVCAILLGGIIQ